MHLFLEQRQHDHRGGARVAQRRDGVVLATLDLVGLSSALGFAGIVTGRRESSYGGMRISLSAWTGPGSAGVSLADLAAGFAIEGGGVGDDLLDGGEHNDILVGGAINVSFVNCSQTNDIDDRMYWGIMGSNYCKNLVYDSCTFSRFDAHKGVASATIRNSVLGHMGINAIGSGTFTVENTTIRGGSLINLRSDYGSTWQGEVIIRNCVFVPAGGSTVSASLIGGYNSGQHDFGYTCYMPDKITIDGLHIDDSNHPEDYLGPAIFADFNTEMTDDSYLETYPYVRTREIKLRNVSTASGKDLRISKNPFMFKDIMIDKLLYNDSKLKNEPSQKDLH